MNFSTLKTFVLLAQNGSFSKTARTLHLSQPAVSHQIKLLEEEMKQALVERKGRITQLTTAGQLLLPYAQRILSLLAESKTALSELEDEGRKLSIGAGTTTIIFRLPDLIQNFKARFPKVELVIKAGSSKEVTELVLNGSLDLGLITTPAPPGALKSLPLYEDEILLIAPVSWPQSQTPLPLRELEKQPLILFPRGSGFRDFIELFFRTHGLHPKVVLELDSMEGIKQMIRIGMGLSFLPQVAVAQEIYAEELISLPLAEADGLYRTTHLIASPDKFWTTMMTEFTTLLKAKFGPAATGQTGH